MNNKYKFKQGDISLLVTLLVCSIILILLAPIAQKVSVESKISRENLMSQQAIQAAKTGLDAWVYNYTEDKIDIEDNFGEQNWPNRNTPGVSNRDRGWIYLDISSGIQYRVVFIKLNEDNKIKYIIRSTGRVKKGTLTIERVLEDERGDL